MTPILYVALASLALVVGGLFWFLIRESKTKATPEVNLSKEPSITKNHSFGSGVRPTTSRPTPAYSTPRGNSSTSRTTNSFGNSTSRSGLNSGVDYDDTPVRSTYSSSSYDHSSHSNSSSCSSSWSSGGYDSGSSSCDSGGSCGGCD